MALRDSIRSAIAPFYIRARLLQERVQSGVVWYPLSEGFVDDPYPTYRELREKDPYHYSPLTGALVISRYEDVDSILRDWRRFSNDQRKGEATGIRNESTRGELTPSILSLDPPDHTRLRGLVNRAFTPRQVAKMEEHIRATAHELLDEVEGQNEFDLMSTLAVGLPTIVIAEMIGVPPEDRSEFKVWSDNFARVLEPNLTPDEGRVVLETAEIFEEYFSRIIQRRRDDLRDDLVSRLIEAEEEGDRLTTDEMQVTLRLLLVAGNETTTNLIGNGMRALLQHPEQMQILREQPELIPNAIEELLRYDSPVQVDMRTVLEDVELGGKVAPAKSRTMLLIGGANRDPEQFERPEELDVTREDAGNISFGRGIHHCLGAPLARLEGKIAFEVLLERYDEIQLSAEAPKYKPNIVLRGLRQFPIRVRRPSAVAAAAGS
jgi:cytochrome P450